MKVVALLDILRSEVGDNPDAEVRVIVYHDDDTPLFDSMAASKTPYHIRVNGGGVNPLNIIAEPDTLERRGARQ